MKTFRFRDFTIYKDARAFRKMAQDLIKNFPSGEKYRLTDQIQRSCLSVLLNIAEGSAKKSDMEFARFLETAIASVNEVVAGFDAAIDDGHIVEQQLKCIEAEAEKLAKQIGSFIQRLRGSKPATGSQKPIAKSQLP